VHTDPSSPNPDWSDGDCQPAPEADLTPVLRDWPLEADRVQVRAFIGADGRRKIQVRLPMGIVQMESQGRPDGLPSALDEVRRLRDGYASVRGDATGFRIEEELCAALREEAGLHQHRCVAHFALGDYDRVRGDAERVLEILDACRRFARRPADREALEHLRPPILLTRARAEVAAALGSGSNRDALDAIERGLAALRVAFRVNGAEDRFEEANETLALRRMRESLVPKLPASQRIELEERLRAAVAAENYELASILRDELRQLG
jgi:hypothetical protein